VIARIAADFVVVLHLAFVGFVVFGAFLVMKWRWVLFLHIPAVVWGALIEFMGWLCPLTPLEQKLRQAGGGAGYTGGFIEHYILPILYPAGFTREVQLVLGAFVIVVNIAAYGWIMARHGLFARRG